MMRRLFLAFAIVALSASHGYGQEAEYGKYICITDRAVGLQTSENGAERYGGAIQMSPGKQKFFVTISKIETLPLNGPQKWVKDGVIQHVPERCFSPENIEKLERQWQNGGGNFAAPNVENFSDWCLARSAAQLNDGTFTKVYYSTGRNVYLNSIGDRFWIFEGGRRFSWMYSTGLVEYILEGRCDLVL